MSFFLYATLRHSLLGVIDVAFVAQLNSRKAAENKRDVEQICYADDGIEYFIRTEEIVDPPPNMLYDDMIEQVSK